MHPLLCRLAALVPLRRRASRVSEQSTCTDVYGAAGWQLWIWGYTSYTCGWTWRAGMARSAVCNLSALSALRAWKGQ